MMSQKRSRCVSTSSIAGVKRALKFDTPNQSDCTKISKISKKNDCVCTSCHRTGLQRNRCLIFKLTKYDSSIPEVREALCERYCQSTCKELICKECDVRLLGLNVAVLSSACAQERSSSSNDGNSEYDKVSAVNNFSTLYVCTCCRFERGDRRKYVIFHSEKYNMNNSNVTCALKYRYSEPGKKEFICRTCHVLLLKDVLPRNALSSPAKDRPLPSSKCLVCHVFHRKKMRLFNRALYGDNVHLDNIMSQMKGSPDRVICSACHAKYLGYSIVTCVQCGSNVLRKRSVIHNPKRFPSHNRIETNESCDNSLHMRLCMLCHKNALGQKAKCNICKKGTLSKHSILFDETNYDIQHYVVATVAYNVSCGLDDTSIICDECDAALKCSTDENPLVSMRVRDPILKSASNFLRAITELPEYACTCCHRLLFRKTVKPFVISDYDFDNPVVKECLSHRIGLRIEEVTDLSRLFLAEKDMHISDHSGHLCIGNITVPEYICARCKYALTRKEPTMPDQACANGLRLYNIPDELSNMFPIERRVISFRIPFITVIVIRRYGGHYKVNGPPVNVPATLDQIVKILPRMPSQLQLQPLKLKRKLEYKSHYMYDMIRRDKVVSALLWLKGNNKHYTDVTIDTGWLNDSGGNLVTVFEDECDIGTSVCSNNCENGCGIAGSEILDFPESGHGTSCHVGNVVPNGANVIERQPYGEIDIATHRMHNKASPECSHVSPLQKIQYLGGGNIGSEGGQMWRECHIQVSEDENVDARQHARTKGNEVTDGEGAKGAESDKELAEDQAAIDHKQSTTGDPLPSVVQFDSLENVIYNCAPGENNIPRYILLDDDFEVLAFPDLFPYGYGGYHSRDVRCRLPIRKYFQQRLLNVDGRFAKNLEYIFCAQYISDIQQIQSDANLALRLSRGRMLNGQRITAGLLQDPVALQQLIRTEQAYKFLKNVRGSPSYWQSELYDVLAMLKKLGIPTWFLTLSAADLHWPEMIQAIAAQYGLRVNRAMINDMSVADKSNFLRQNPVTGVRMFQHRIESFFSKYLLSSSNPIGCVTDYVIKIEFQMRGSPHAHCLLWVKDAPKLDRDDDATVCSFIDRYVSAVLPDASLHNKRTRDFMLRLQQHTHSDYCRRGKRCRFGFPKPPSYETLICRRPEGEGSENIIEESKAVLKKVHDELNDNGELYARNNICDLLCASGVSQDVYCESLKVTSRGPTVILRRNPCDVSVNSCNVGILNLWGANVDLQYVVNEVATVMYVCSYMTKGEKAMGETLKRVAKECMRDDMRTQMNKIKKEFLGKRVIGAPESCMRVLSSWLMKKSRKVIYVNSNMKSERVSLPKTKAQLSRMAPDDDDVFATSLIDRYSSRPYDLADLCLAEFAVNYDVASAKKTNATSNDLLAVSSCEGKKIKLRNELGYMQKRKTPSILRTRRFKLAVEPDRYYHAKLILYYPWFNEDTLLGDYASYQIAYEARRDVIVVNAQMFNDDCDDFDIDISAIDGCNDSVWDLVAPSVSADDSLTAKLGFATVQEHTEDGQHVDNGQSVGRGLPSDVLSRLYLQASEKQGMRFQTYCDYVCGLNDKQKDIVMFNRMWCKTYIHKYRLGEKIHGYRVFLSGCGGTGKSHVVRLIQRDMSYLLQHVLRPEPDQPIVLVTAPTGSAAYNIGGSTVHSALCINDRTRGSVSYERKCMMQVKLEHLMLLVTDEVSMIGFDFFQRMNEVVTSVKGLTGGNWGNICVLTVGDLFQLPPVASAPVYSTPRNVNSLSDLAPNGWEQFKLHELTEVMRQKDIEFVNALNNIRVKQPDICSSEHRMLMGRELKISREDEKYPHTAMHVYAQNIYCDEWNEYMLNRLPGVMFSNIAVDSRKDTSTNLASITFPDKPRDTGNLRHTLHLKIGARVMLTTNVDVSDGLTNGSMGVVVHIAHDTSTAKMKSVLVKFDDENVGVNARNSSVYKNVHPRAVPISKGQATFTLSGRKSCNAARTQFPLTLAWAVTIHKCQGLTLSEVVVDMSPEKGKFSSGQAYVAFSRVRSLEKLHIVNYTRSQIRVSPNAESEMVRLRESALTFCEPRIPAQETADLTLLHINICALVSKLPYIVRDRLFKTVGIISINETHLSKDTELSPSMLGLDSGYTVFRYDRSRMGGGVALVLKTCLKPVAVSVPAGIEIVAVKISLPLPMVIVAVYRPPTQSMSYFSQKISEILTHFKDSQICLVGDLNEDILLSKEKTCCGQIRKFGLRQWVDKPTRDSGMLIDHLYTSTGIKATCDVIDCFYSDHDFVACSLNRSSAS